MTASKPEGGSEVSRRAPRAREGACGVETHTLRTTRTIAAHLRAHAIHRRRDRAARRGRGKVCSEGPTSDLKRAPTAERFDLRSYLLNLPLDPPKSAN